MKKCPFCAKEIQDEAIKCKHCGERLSQKEIEGKILCPNCNMEILQNSHKCKFCGQDPQKSKFVTQSNAKTRMCLSCGRLYNDSWKICQDCRTELVTRDKKPITSQNEKIIEKSSDKLTSKKRPLGVTILGWLINLQAVIGILGGTTNGDGFTFALSIFALIVGVQLLKLDRRAVAGALILYVITIGLYIYGGIKIFPLNEELSLRFFAISFWALVILIIMIFYFSNARVKDHFKIEH